MVFVRLSAMAILISLSKIQDVVLKFFTLVKDTFKPLLAWCTGIASRRGLQSKEALRDERSLARKTSALSSLCRLI